MNAPDRYERFVVPEGMKKVSYERDMKIMNAATFTIQREDHTIGNVIRMQLHRDPNVLFAGYRLPHPLQYKLVIKIISLVTLLHSSVHRATAVCDQLVSKPQASLLPCKHTIWL